MCAPLHSDLAGPMFLVNRFQKNQPWAAPFTRADSVVMYFFTRTYISQQGLLKRLEGR
jgi:hypothetical protein